jgi:hypothetical protein
MDLDSQSFAQKEPAHLQEVQPSLRPLFTPKEEQEIWCTITKMSVAADRRNNGMTGQELSEFHKEMLRERCEKIDFGKWVAEDEVNREANHRAIEALMKKEKSRQQD